MCFLYSSRPAMVMTALLLGAVQQIHGLIELGTYGTIVYEETYGFPIEVPINFESDLVAKAEGSAGTNEIYFTYAVSGTAAPYYSSDSMSINSPGPGSGEIQIDLVKNGDAPPVGTYGLTLAVNLMLANPCCSDILQDFMSYTITINVQGTESTQTVSTQGATGTFTEQTLTGNNAGQTTSTLPGDLGLAQSGGAVSYPNDLVIVASTADTAYNIWIDSSVAVEVYNSAVLSTENLVYEWPASFVNAPSTEGAAPGGGSLTINLQQVPVALYTLGTVYVKLTVYYRDTEGDRRRHVLRTLPASIDQHRGLERKEAASKQFSTKVELDSESAPEIESNDRSSSSENLPIPLVAGIAVGGLVFILIIVFVCKKICGNKNETEEKGDNDTVEFEIPADRSSQTMAEI